MLYIQGSALYKCLINLPEDPLVEESYPLIVGLHGGGHDPDNLITLWDNIPNRSFIFCVPQAPYPSNVDTEIKFDWAMWPSGNEELISQATELSEKYIVNVVQDMSQRYNIDEVYLLGWSQGAIFSYLVGIQEYHLFKGIICFSGPGLLAPLINPFADSFDPDWLTEEFILAAKNLRIFITHGKEDQAVNYELGIKSRDVLINHGYDVTFSDFEGGHSYPPERILRKIVGWIQEPNQRHNG